MFNKCYPRPRPRPPPKKNKILPFMRYVEKYGTTGQPTNYNIPRHIRVACWTTMATDTH